MYRKNLTIINQTFREAHTKTYGIVLLFTRELEKMRRVGKVAANLLNYLEQMVQPGADC
ncbi:hypothetical protein [Okeania sp. SIO2B3]|uniref:hypothetical protein n=1 Tax=Okeania sp. SIO2B3 TaxID=2607784 RepID=UPI0025CFE9B7|nr:hypothetical protein [Okeania sp. SIO2B3]